MTPEILNLSLLEKDLKAHKQIVLFVGAGINYSYKVNLLWEHLINHLFENALVRISMGKGLDGTEYSVLRQAFGIDSDGLSNIPYNKSLHDITEILGLSKLAAGEFPLLVKASVIKSVLGESYLSFIQDYIYDKCSKKIIKESFEKCYTADTLNSSNSNEKLFHSLYQTARMIILCEDIKAVLTYNYDNFLSCAVSILLKDKEKYFIGKELAIVNSRQINIKDVSGLSYEDCMTRDTIFIYHVHGYIPPPSEADDLSGRNIVMSLEEYHEYSMNDLAAWQTSTQLHFLSHYTCLFLGLSLSDITTQRLLHHVQKSGNMENLYQLYAYNDNRMGNSIFSKVHQAIVEMKMDFHLSYGLTPIVCTGSYEELYKSVADMVRDVALS